MHWHKWSKWSLPTTDKSNKKRQWKRSKKCGLLKSRSIGEDGGITDKQISNAIQITEGDSK